MPFLETEGARLHYREAGSGGPAVVLLHGGMCSSADWEHQLRALAGEHRVVAPDLRCHGLSTGDPASFTVESCARDLIALIEALGLAPALLVGHSFAARIVLHAAAARPDIARGVILLDGSRSVGGFAASEPSPGGLPMQASLAEILDATIGPYAGGTVRSRLTEAMAATSPEVMQASVAALQDWDEHDADGVVAGLEAGLPLLAIQSTYHDRFTPRRSFGDEAQGSPYLAWLKSARPGLETLILPETGHFSMLERPERVTELIEEFSARTMGEQAWHA